MMDSNSLDYKPYKDNRFKKDKEFTCGLSGPLLIAEGKDGMRYLVKHTFPHNAANEYVSLWLAKKMDILCPRAELLSPNNCFNSPYAVAIEYIDGFKSFSPEEMTDKLKSDFINHYALAVLTATEDRVQMRKVGNRLYSFDYSEAFYLGETQINLFKLGEDIGEEFLRRAYTAYSERPLIFDLPKTAKENHISPEDMTNGMLQTAKRILTITDDDLLEMEAELDQIYPITIGVYYECCIKSMQERIAKLI